MSDQKYFLGDPNTKTSNDTIFKDNIGHYFNSSSGATVDKLENFARFTPRQSLALFLAKSAIFEKIVKVHGAIVECGVFMGGGTFTWAQLSSIYEPINHNRRVIGFDTFDGFPSISGIDQSTGDQGDKLLHKKEGGYSFRGEIELADGVQLFDLNRPIGHIPKIEFVKGDANQTIPEYLKRNPHLVVALLYLDFDLYEPTLAALKTLFERMPKGAVIVFDELNQSHWPGETVAVLEHVGIRNLRIERFDFSPAISYAVLD